MLSSKTLSILASATMIAAGLSAWARTASSGSPQPDVRQAEFVPLQSVSSEFGSKFMSGYFVAQAGQCAVTLMIIDRSDPDALLTTTAARVRLMLHPGQIAGLDSEEGRSLNLTCGESASKLLLDAGPRDVLVARQTRAVPEEFAKME